MRTRLWIAAVSSTLLALTSPAFAGCTASACQDERIVRLYVNLNGIIFVETTGDMSQLNCTRAGGVYMTFNMSEPGAEALFSLLLTAKTAGQPVTQIRIADGSDGCDIVYAY